MSSHCTLFHFSLSAHPGLRQLICRAHKLFQRLSIMAFQDFEVTSGETHARRKAGQ